nr:hypothetical protein [Tanacetum cinerariifolium]
MFIPSVLIVPKLQTAKDLQGDALLHYDAEIKVMNLILLSIPNDIYNSMDSCTSAKDMCKRVERLMRGTIQNKVDRETRFKNEFDQFVAEPGEALVFVYNRFAQLMNDLERNDMHLLIVTINTKFLNSLQPEWLKYVTQVRHAKRLTLDMFDDLFYYLQQFKKLFNTSRAKKLEKSHDSLALVVHTSSSSRNTSSYYVTHPMYVVDYDDEYQQDDIQTNLEDPLASAMLLLARAISQNFSNSTNNRLRTSSNTKNQVIIQGDRVNIQRRNSGHYARNCPKPRVQDSKYFMEQMLLAKQDEAGVILIDEQNDFLFADASRLEEIEDLSANICLMARIQLTNNTSDAGPSYDSAFISKTSPDKQRGANSNKNVIAPGMYKVVTTQESQTNKTKSGLSTTGMNDASSVRRLINRDLHDKNSVLANSKNSAKKVAVYIRKNKQTNNTSSNVISNKENVIDVNVANASKAKTLLCVSYTTYVVLKTRFSEKLAQSKTLDTTSVVSKPKIDVGSASKAKSKVVQIVMWIVNSGCSKHTTGDRSPLRNFIEKFMGTVRFENDNFAAITGYGGYIQGNITIFHVYYVEGLRHNLFSIGQFCDGDLEVAFHSKTCYVRNLERDDLITGRRESNLYTISISDMAASSSGKSKKASHPPKLVPSDNSKLELLHMDLCRPMRVASINGKKYILVIVDDYSRYTWVYFLHLKDKTPEIIKKFITQAQLNYKAKVCKIRTDNGTEFKNATLKAHYEKLGIMQQFLTARTPQQNGVVQRRNRTLVEATRTMLIFSRLHEFL